MNYSELLNLPCLNGCSIIGNKRLEDYGLVPMTAEDVTEIMLEVFGYVL